VEIDVGVVGLGDDAGTMRRENGSEAHRGASPVLFPTTAYFSPNRRRIHVSIQ
jgi:hypothetical protein